jgi:hypothetical protein
MIKTFTGPVATQKANKYLHSEGRQFTHWYIEILDIPGTTRIYQIVTTDILHKYIAADRDFIVLN